MPAVALSRVAAHAVGSPLHYHASYLGGADLAAAAVRAGRQLEGREILDCALHHLDGTPSPRRRQRRINEAKPLLIAALETPDALSELTPQQRQIIHRASDGLTNREIADRLYLSPRTVSSHLYRSYPKLGVAGRHQPRDVITAGIRPARHKSADE